MPTLTINGHEVTVPKGTPIIRAAAMVGVNIPHFCYHPALSAPANCRMCLVEVERARKLEPSCYMKCADGMVVHTESEKVITARKAVLEFILINHPVDCPICDQAGECKLQDYYMAYDAQPSRLSTPKVGKAKVHPIGPHVVYDGERCILCTRCVRFCDEVTGTSELTTVERGDHSEIRTFPGKELDNAYSMNVTDICPVGALTTRDFRFKCRVWLMSSADSICIGCSKGCNVHLEHFRGEVQRYRPRFNAEVNEYWMCDAGRLSYKRVHEDRSTVVRVDTSTELSWPRAARAAAEKLNTVAARHGAAFAFVVSARMSLESLLAAKQYHDAFLPDAPIYWVGRPDGDADDFLIRADKNPNRRGIAAIFGSGVLKNDSRALLAALQSKQLRAMYLLGTELALTDSERSAFADAVGGLDLFAVQSLHRGGLTDAAHIAFPAASHAEQEGHYINEDGVVQPAYAAFDAKGESLPDWAIFGRLARGADAPLAFESLADLQSELFDTAADGEAAE